MVHLPVNTFFNGSSLFYTDGGSLPGVAKKSGILLPKFGKMLMKARGGRDKGLVVALMHTTGGLDQMRFSRSQLDRYEAGERHSPDPVVLMRLAQIYEADITEWLQALAEERETVAVAAIKQMPRARAREAPHLEPSSAKPTKKPA